MHEAEPNAVEVSVQEKQILLEVAQAVHNMGHVRIDGHLVMSARVVRRYSGQWVGVQRGQVQASGPSLGAVLVVTEAMGLKRSDLTLGFIDSEGRIRLV